MSCGRNDGEPSNQPREIPQAQAFSPRPVSRLDCYNRLEYYRLIRFLHAGVRYVRRLLAPPTHPSARLHLGTPSPPMKPRAFLSLMQGRQSCHQQLWGVTPFRKGIA
jgi:hypothetical protein